MYFIPSLNASGLSYVRALVFCKNNFKNGSLLEPESAAENSFIAEIVRYTTSCTLVSRQASAIDLSPFGSLIETAVAHSQILNIVPVLLTKCTVLLHSATLLKVIS